jgi:hypothetical protein
MIKTRIASTAAVFTFGLAAVGGTVVAIAAPANAETGSAGSSSSASTDGPDQGTVHAHLRPGFKPQSIQPGPHDWVWHRHYWRHNG